MIARGPSDVRTTSGSRVQFDCDVTGEPQPIVRWLRDAVPVPLTTSEKYLITRQGALVIQVLLHSLGSASHTGITRQGALVIQVLLHSLGGASLSGLLH